MLSSHIETSIRIGRVINPSIPDLGPADIPPKIMAATEAPSSSSSSNYMLAGLNCANNIHLIIGTNPLAAARCSQSLGAGAHPVLIAPETAELHYSLQRRVDDGSVKWVRTAFKDEHLFELGREEVGRVVDAVFVTSGSREELGKYIPIYTLYM